jgi:diacylglycerol kinase (ATP)
MEHREKTREKKRFSMRARVKSATHGWRGLGILIRTTHNAWGQIFFGLLAVYLGFILHISEIEWVLIVLAIGLVLVAETLNTALEIDINLTSPEFHPYARDTKDVAAGAVLIAVMTSLVVGLVIFLPKIL